MKTLSNYQGDRMADTHETIRTEILDKLVSYAKEQLPPEQAKLVLAFIPQFYRNIPFEDLNSRSIADLYGVLLSNLELMKLRSPKQCNIRVYNPQRKRDHWHSNHTVVNLSYTDMPFLVDSMRMELNRLGLTTHLLINLGGLKVRRDSAGNLLEILPTNTQNKEAITEAVIHMEIDHQTDPSLLEKIRANLLGVMQDVTVVVADWEKMREKIFIALNELDKSETYVDREEVEETKAFLRWLVTDHFTFLGFREYKVIGAGNQAALHLVSGTGLGVLRNESASKAIRSVTELPPKARELVFSPQILIISKTNTKSTVHRSTYTDYIGVKRFDATGKIIGEYRFIGLFTSEAYNSNPKHIPFLRLKVDTVLQMSGLPRNGHSAKALNNILATLPRDDLFQAGTDALFELAMGIYHLQERRRIRLFIREDTYGRYLSCLIYVPRENFNTDLLYRMREILTNAFNATEITFATHFSASILARIHFVVRVDPKKPLNYDAKAIEQKLVEVGRSWKDDLRDNLITYFGEEKANILLVRYQRAFPAGYRETFLSRVAIDDIKYIEKLTPEHDLEMSFYRPSDAPESTLRFKLFHLHATIPLSDALPMLENMGLRVIEEQPYEIIPQDHATVWINDFSMIYPQDVTLNVEENKEIFQNAFNKIWRGEAEDDAFNRLVLRAQLDWREITVLRAYAKYLRQTGFPFSQPYMEEALVNNPSVTVLLIRLFKLHFDPKLQEISQNSILALEEQITKELDLVTNLDQDRILRRYMEVIRATLRTNFFQTDAAGNPKPYLSFKLNPKLIPELPLPLPMFEIFVYSPRFEGVHLRAGKVARGGLRWSDRREDFRTEILGLMKAQQVKNAVIVPAGAKGGFVLKNLPLDGNRDVIMEEAISCYKNFIRGLLDLTDNLVGGEVVHPKNTVFYDENDPYLVVAADKGTATFSDIANSIAKEYNFWLGDAFASGGSSGYDHKKMAITSRGVWESVKQHFQELAFDFLTQPFTVVGIGDMSGDVFGNGMLLSENIQLVAAFNHMHIFLDPNPNPKTSFQERKRLFNLPRSTWDDYNRDLISPGGGVYKRSAKSIKLSPEVQQLLDLKKDTIIPTELISALLRARVDLIWNGGIGTYVKAISETNNDVGDRANDAIRINGNELQTRIVGEGGNLGFTQLGRIEYALQDGKINTDFIDNSGGVDCSDHEVNIKILLNEIVARGEMTEPQRNELLVAMTEEVARLVLKHNYRQVRTLTRAAMQSNEYLSLYGRFIEDEERNGKINRQLEFLPDNKTLQERKLSGKGLTRPELAVLLAYSKIILKEDILSSSLIEDSYLNKYLESAFPKLLVERFPQQVRQHRLHREIIATQLSNALVNNMGITFVYQMQDETGLPVDAIVRSYVISYEIFGMFSMSADISALDYKVDPQIQTQMTFETITLIRRSTRWFLRNKRLSLNIADTIKDFSSDVDQLYQLLPKLLIGAEKENLQNNVKELVDAQVPAPLATRIASSRYIYSALNIIQVAKEQRADIKEVAAIYFMLAERLELVWFREKINAYPVDTHWTVLARATFKSDLDTQLRALTVSVLKHRSPSKEVTARIDAWLAQHQPLIERWQKVLADLRSSAVIDSAMLSVAIRELQDLAEISIHNSHTKK